LYFKEEVPRHMIRIKSSLHQCICISAF
jgi:hypothetical protein